ncbi:MAG TPA: cation:dicarboxylase symporter family transporter [Pyrinomonadaceae bacterium]|nr:cation:dicarboxylase symporter family transporter [Pyrinomonadaceae bacterium]
MKRLSLTTWSLLALAAGLGLGILGHAKDSPIFADLGNIAKALGGLWVAALQLTVIPLVITHLLAAVSGAGAKAVGKLGVRAFVLFFLMLVASGLFTVLLAPPLIARFSVDPATIESLKTAAALPVATATPTASADGGSSSPTDWIANLLPTNLLEAGVRGDIFPLLLFTVVFALAVTCLPEAQQLLLAQVFQGLADAMLQVTRWVLVATPVGVFALTYVLAFKTGSSTGGMLGAYVVIVSTIMLLFTVLLYPLSAIAGRTRIRTFTRAVAPAQLVAASTRSSIAALPALVEGGRDHLRLPKTGTSFVLPLSVSLFKVNRPISSIVKLMLVAHIYGIPLRLGTIALFLGTVIIISFGTAGIPQSGPGLKTLPAYLAAGVPIEGVIVIEAVESIPDIFKTLLNVTGDMSAATLLSRSDRSLQGKLSAAETPSAATESAT